MIRRLSALAVLFSAVLPVGVHADTLDLTGTLTDGNGQPLAQQSFRLVLGSDPAPRGTHAGRVLTTDARGRFALQADVTLPTRSIVMDTTGRHHNSRLLELGFEFTLLNQPALYWAEIDFTAVGPLTGLQAFVARGSDGFTTPLTFHPHEFDWSVPGDPNGWRLSEIGANVAVNDWNNGEGGVWRLDVSVEHHRFEIR